MKQQRKADTDWPDYEKYAKRHARRWSRLNEVLYAMCRDAPRHDDVLDIYAKVGIIGRTYASGIERHAAEGLEGIVGALHKARKWLDSELSDLAKLEPRPWLEHTPRIVALHGRVLDAVARHTRAGNRPRSFVSKYLHFHAPIVPIYDSIVAAKIQGRAWYPWRAAMSRGQKKPPAADATYYRYCVRIAIMAEDWRAADLDPTARNMDTYIYQYEALS